MNRFRTPRWLTITAAMGILLWPGAVSAAQASADEGHGHTRNTTQTYIIHDAELIKHPDRVTNALSADGNLDRLGIKPVEASTGLRASAEPAEQPASYVVPSSRFPNGSKPDDPYQYATSAECWAHLNEAARVQGWIKNRYSYCQTYMIVRQALHCGDFFCSPAGVFVATPMIFGQGKIGSYATGTYDRWAQFDWYIHPLRITGAYLRPDATISMSMSCKGYINHERDDAACHPGDNNGRTTIISNLRSNDHARMDLVSDAQEPVPWSTQVASGVYQPKLDINLPGYEPILGIDGEVGGMRFDSAWYLAPTSPSEQMGSVFDRATPGFSYDTDDNAVQDVAEHIDGARRNPDDTVPNAPGKHLAGASRSDPLHRLAPGAGQYQNDRYSDNRGETSAFCSSDGMPEKPPTGVWECDEYPFASTYEGSARYRVRYEDNMKHWGWWSAQWVLEDDNQEAGRRLGRWYTTDRILDNDPFFVPIT